MTDLNHQPPLGQRGLAAFRSEMDFGTCIKRHDGAIDWATWEDAE